MFKSLHYSFHERASVKTSQKQSGSAHAVIIVILVLAVLGLLGFVFWQNFINKKTVTQTTNQTQSAQTEAAKPATLDIQPLGKTLSLGAAPYTDITYAKTSVNTDDANKYVIAIYSKDLNARLVADLSNKDGAVDTSLDYWKYSGNRAVYAYYYTPSTDSVTPDMIDGVAGNIINPEQRTATSKFYVGFMGPGAPTTKELSAESTSFLDWVVANLK